MSLADARKKAAARKQQPAPAKGALGALRKKRDKPDDNGKPTGALGALKKKKAGPALSGLAKRRKESSKHDFTVSNVTYCNARIRGERGPFLWGSVDLVSGNQRWTAHNKFGSWLIEIPGKPDHFREPAALGIGSQIELATRLTERLDAEIKAQGLLTPAEKRAISEAELAEKRKKEEAKRKRLETLRKNKAKAKKDDKK